MVIKVDNLVKKYGDIKELNSTILNELIEKVVISEVEKVNGKPTQTMEIYFRFPYIATLKIR